MSFVVSAVVAAAELGTVAAIATAVTQVGIAMTVVGTVTKSKELTSIGKVMTVGGGVASLGAAAYNAFSSGLTTAAAEAGTGSLAEQAAADASTNLATDAAENVAADGFAGAAKTAADSAIGATEGIGAASTGAPASGALTTGYDTAANLTGEAGKAAAGAASAIGEDAAAEKWAISKGFDAAGSQIAAQAPSALESISSWWSKLPADAKSRYSTALLQAGGSAVGGLFNGWTESQKLDLQREIQAQSEKKYQDSLKNANAVPVIRYTSGGLVSNATKGG